MLKRVWRAAAPALALALASIAMPSAKAQEPQPAAVSAHEPPYAWVTDEAGLLTPAARDRVGERLKTFHDDSFVRIYVYTLRNAEGRPVNAFMQDLYRAWHMRDRELWDGLATVFVFAQEGQARVFLGNGAPAGFEDAARGIESDLGGIFTDGTEPGLLRVIDRLDVILRGLPRTFLEAPGLPAEPGGPIYGQPRLDPADQRAIGDAFARASRESGHEIVLAFNPAKGFDSPDQRTETLAAAWPGRTLLCYYRDEGRVLLRPDAKLRDNFPQDEILRIEAELTRAVTEPTLARTLVRLAGEIGELSQGHTIPRWNKWRHPYQALSGGQDAELLPPALALGILAVALFLIGWFLRALVRNPRQVLTGILMVVVQGLLGALFSGGGRSSGGGFSGGGGGSGGGGATGHW